MDKKSANDIARDILRPEVERLFKDAERVRDKTIDEITTLLRRVADAGHPELPEFRETMNYAAERVAALKSGKEGEFNHERLKTCV